MQPTPPPAQIFFTNQLTAQIIPLHFPERKREHLVICAIPVDAAVAAILVESWRFPNSVLALVHTHAATILKSKSRRRIDRPTESCDTHDSHIGIHANCIYLPTWVFPKNRGGPPKWMVYNGKPLLKFMIWGVLPLFFETTTWIRLIFRFSWILWDS